MEWYLEIFRNNKVNLVHMKNGKWFLAFVIAGVFAVGCNQEENEQLKQQNAALQSQLQETDSTVNVLLTTFNELDSNLSLIRQKEGLIEVSPEMSKDKRTKVLADIDAINKLMEENRTKITKLQADLKKSGRSMKQFEKKLAQMQTELDERAQDIVRLQETLTAKDFQIAGLSNTVDTLNTRVSSQVATIQQQTSFIQDLDKELNKTYMTEGTYKELRERGVIDKNGWTPWTGKKIVLNDNLSKAGFTEIDRRQTTSIPINAKKAKLVSDHPQSSYEFQKTEDGAIASLEIKDPYEFWSISKFLVVELK
jgi:flagellar biosynthesis chaperone FliJ